MIVTVLAIGCEPDNSECAQFGNLLGELAETTNVQLMIVCCVMTSKLA